MTIVVGSPPQVGTVTVNGTPSSMTVAVQGPQGPSGTIDPGTAGQILATNATATTTQWVTVSGDATASATTPGQLTVTAIQGHAVANTAPTTNYVLAWSGTAWAPTNPSTITSGGVTPGTAGQVYITNGTPASAWTSLISVETTHGRFTAGGSGTDHLTVMGPYVGNETGYSAFWALPNATAPTASNYLFLSNGGDAWFNAPTAGASLHLLAGNGADYVTIGNNIISVVTPSTLQFNHSATIGTNVAGGTVTLQVDTAGTWGTMSTGGLSLGANIVPTFTTTATAGVWRFTNNVAGQGTLVIQNTSATGYSLQEFHDNLDVVQASFGYYQVVPEFRINGYGGGTGIAVNTYFNSSLRQSIGSTAINYSDGTNTRASIELTHGKITAGGSGLDTKAVIGPLVGGEATNAALYLLDNATSATSANYVMLSNGVSTTFNTPLALGSGGHFEFWSGNTNHLLDLNGTTTTLMQAPQSLTVGTNAASAVLTLQADTAASVMQLAGGTQAGTWTLGTHMAIFGHIRSPEAWVWAAQNAANTNAIALMQWGGDSLTFGASNVNTMGFVSGSWISLTAATYLDLIGPANIYLDTATVDFRDAARAETITWVLNSAGATSATIAAGVTGFTLSQATQTLEAATANITIHAQAPWPSAVTNLVAGDVIVNTPASVGAGNKYGGLRTQYNGFDVACMGTFGSSGTAGALWLGNSVSATSYAVYGDPTRTMVNAGTDLYLQIAGTTVGHCTSTLIDLFSNAAQAELQLSSTTQLFANTANFLNWAGTEHYIRWSSTSAYVILGDTNVTSYLGSPTVEWQAGITSPTLTQEQPSADVAPQNLTIQAQAPWPSAVTNVNAGDVIVRTPTSVVGSTKFGGFVVEYGTTPMVRMGTTASQLVAGLWMLDGGAPDTTNIVLERQSNSLYVNAPAGGYGLLSVGGFSTSPLGWNANAVSIGGYLGGLGGGVGVLYVGNATTAPTSNPTSGFVAYGSSGRQANISSNGHVVLLPG